MKKPLILFIKLYRMSTKELLFNKKVTVNMQTLGTSKDRHFFKGDWDEKENGYIV